ncbi:hypothetical protein C9412_11275 [Stenotrophomonas sp. Nf1]|nr:hypothetical protein C9412_11275 [Stenotrophomonas sp. Nf1]PTA79484.1 hypothetical protein C9416_11765 [Stenotrophomonas sp. Nf4]
MDGFTASPATGPTPPTHRKPLLLLLLLRLLPWSLQVQGAALPTPPPATVRRTGIPAAGSTLARCPACPARNAFCSSSPSWRRC